MINESIKIVMNGAVKICKTLVWGRILTSVMRSTKIMVSITNHGKNNHLGKRVALYSYTDIRFSSRKEAEAVLNTLREQISEYGLVSVGDLYDVVGIIGPFTTYRRGWKNLINASVIRIGGEYALKLPPAQVFD